MNRKHRTWLKGGFETEKDTVVFDLLKNKRSHTNSKKKFGIKLSKPISMSSVCYRNRKLQKLSKEKKMSARTSTSESMDLPNYAHFHYKLLQILKTKLFPSEGFQCHWPLFGHQYYYKKLFQASP